MSQQNDVIYAITENRDLLWYRHDGRNDGSFRWASNEGKKVGNGWNAKEVFSGGGGIIYAIQDNGDLLWYRHDGRNDGSFKWASNAGKKVSTGWNGFSTVFSGGDGVIYAIEEASRDPRTGQRTGGHLLWYRHDGRNDGSFRWASNEGKKVGTGWNGFSTVFSGGDGIIYAIQDNGDLLWYRHNGRSDGSFRWAENSGKKVGAGWNGFSTVFSGGDGVIYAIEEASRDPRTGQRTGGGLKWYRHDGWRDGSLAWAEGPKTVGNGWNGFSSVFSGGGGYDVYGAIGDKYSQLGGPNSWLGWPTSDEQAFPQDGRVNTFENGAIYWWPDTGAIELGSVSLQYKGLYCFGETDELSDSDEPYVILGVVPTLPAQPATVRTRVYDERGGVDAGNSRPDSIELYRGLPYGMALGVVLMENDQGDPDKYLEEINQGVVAAGAAVTTACAGIPYVGPVVALACAALFKEYGDDIAKVVNDILGTGDDVIEKWVWNVTAKEMVTMARAPQLNFWGIEHHLESKLLSDGEASYKVYLAVYAV